MFYERHVFFCTNLRRPGHPAGCCAEKGAEELRNYMKSKARAAGLRNVRVNTAGCLDRCPLGPVMVIYPEGIWYNYSSQADIDEIIQTHLLNDQPVERLRLSDERHFAANREAAKSLPAKNGADGSDENPPPS